MFMCVTQLFSNSMNPKLSPTANIVTTAKHIGACTSEDASSFISRLYTICMKDPSSSSHWRNNYAPGTLGWIFKGSGALLTRICLPRCLAVGSMWCTKPRLSMPSTSPGWRANWEDAQLHAPSIHYQAIAMPPQFLELRCLKNRLIA